MERRVSKVGSLKIVISLRPRRADSLNGDRWSESVSITGVIYKPISFVKAALAFAEGVQSAAMLAPQHQPGDSEPSC